MRRFVLTGLLGIGFIVACGQDAATSSPRTAVAPQEPGASGPGGGGATAGSVDAGTAAASADPDSPEPTVPFQPFDINHVVSTGQSNSVAHEGVPVLSTTQPYKNLMFDVGVMTSGTCEREGCRTYQKPSSFVPLVEGDTFWYPVETMSAGLANEATRLASDVYGQPGHELLVSLAGRNGLTYWCLRKGGCNFLDPTYLNAFDESMRQVGDAVALAKASKKSYVVRAVTAIHGESDDYAYATNTQEFPIDGTDGTPQSIKTYADALIEWQRDYENGIKQRTGQTIPIPLLISQHSGWNDIATSAVAGFQYEAHVRSKGKVVLVTAGYPLDYNEDCRHYTNNGERQLGEYFAKVYARVVFAGQRWEPVHPRSASIANNVISVKFHVPKPPLVFDTDWVTDPGNQGFEVVDAAGARLPIASVALAGPDTVTITLGSGAKPSRLRYAMTTIPQTCPGRKTGARGTLRDSDDAPSQYGYALYNWAVHFDVAISGS